jgi:hypothetical protein
MLWVEYANSRPPQRAINTPEAEPLIDGAAPVGHEAGALFDAPS